MLTESDQIKLPLPPVWRAPAWLVSIVSFVIALSLWPFRDGVTDMWRTWVTSEEYSHCLLILPVAAFLIWQRRDRLRQMEFSGSWLAIPLVLLGGGMLLLGQLGTVYTLVEYAYLVTLYGLALSLLGGRAFRVIVAPLLILLFMIPLPTFLLNNLSMQLQLLSSKLGVLLIRLFNVSVFLEGNVIDLGGYKLEVAEACSGLRYLFPLMTLGFLMAYFYKGALWKRIVVFASSAPITVVMNSLRVGLIGITVDRWGTEMAEGYLHEFQGWTIFMMSAAILILEMAALHRIGREKGSWQQLFGIELPETAPANAPRRNRGLPLSFLAAAMLILGFIGTDSLVPRPVETVPVRGTFTEFPMHLAGWRGRSDSLDAVYTDQLKLDDYLLANYVRESVPPINVYISWYNSQRKGEAVHSPRSCLPGGGWEISSFAPLLVNGTYVSGQPLRVNRAVIQLGNEREVVYYWFQQRGRVIDNEFAVKWYIFWDALTRHRTDGAMVRLITPLLPGSGEDNADQRLTQFASAISPALTRYIPN